MFEANLSHANLFSSEFWHTDLRNADLSHVNLVICLKFWSSDTTNMNSATYQNGSLYAAQWDYKVSGWY